MLLDQAGHLVASLRLETVEVWVSCEVLTLWLSLSLTLSSHTGNPNCMIWYRWKIMIPERRNHQFTLLIFRRPCFSNAYFTFKTIWMKIAEFLAKFQTWRLGGLCARVPHHPNIANFLRNFALQTVGYPLHQFLWVYALSNTFSRCAKFDKASMNSSITWLHFSVS